MKFFLKTKNILISFCVLTVLASCGSEPDRSSLKRSIHMVYPQSGVIFPPELPAPTFRWDRGSIHYEKYLITVTDTSGKQLLQTQTKHRSWQPGDRQWNKLKQLSVKSPCTTRIYGYKDKKAFAYAEMDFTTSADSVGAPIFFRNVPLPFSYANKHKDILSWHLGSVENKENPKTLLTGIPVCANCHSFTADGSTMAMDVDYSNDKGNYAISPIKDTTLLSPDNIISWSDFKREDGDFTFALLSQISPDGRYVVSTVKDRSIFVPVDDLEYSQLFFPFKGILAIYDRQTREFWALPGADDPELVQSNPCWSPDGKTILFARSPRYYDKEAESSHSAVLGKGIADEFISGRQGFQFDMYQIPFNHGKGGKAVPVPGASRNNKSNFFPKYSPDGKYIIFCQADNFMLLQKDSRMFIISVDGGQVREMTCNTSNMNSWHSWSPNGRWIVFTSKAFGPYTQLMLAHVDENGVDAPAVLLEHFQVPERAANIPEFVNCDPEMFNNISDKFSETGNYYIRSATELYFLNERSQAEKNFNKAIDLNPDDYRVHFRKVRLLSNISSNELGQVLNKINHFINKNPKDLTAILDRAEVLIKLQQFDMALKDCNYVLSINPKTQRGLHMKSSIESQTGRSTDALATFNKMIALDPKNDNAYNQRSLLYYRSKKLDLALADAQKALEINPNNHEYYINLGIYLANSGQAKDAEAALNNALILKPKFYYALYIKGLICRQQGKQTEARDIFMKSVKSFDKFVKENKGVKPVLSRSMITAEL